MSEARGTRAGDEEDWTHISDKTVRKRVQNRLAQRNYRKSLKAKLNELERLATREGSLTTNNQPGPEAPARDPPSSSKPHSEAPRGNMSDLDPMNVSMSGTGFPLDNSEAGYMYHPPLSNYPTGSGMNSLNLVVPATNPFQVSGWVTDGNLLPATDLSVQNYVNTQGYSHPQNYPHTSGTGGGPNHMGCPGLASDMDSIGRHLSQHRHSLSCSSMQPYTLSTSSRGSSDRSGHSTNPSRVQDRDTPSDIVSAHDNEAASSCASRQRPASKHSTRMSSESPRRVDDHTSPPDLQSHLNSSSRVDLGKVGSKARSSQRHRLNAVPAQTVKDPSLNSDHLAPASATLSVRIASAIKAIHALGFSNIEELTTQFYTANLQDQPALADTQRISRRRGLTRILAKLREHSKDDWTDWEAQGYREEIVRAAEDIIGDECSRFSVEDTDGNVRGNTNMAELKRRYQDELPDLYSLINVLNLSSQRDDDEDRSTVVVNVISAILGADGTPTMHGVDSSEGGT